MRVFYLGQLGKYLPGTIWPAVTQMRLGRDYRVPPRASGAAFAVFMLLLVGTGLLVGVPVIPLLGRDAAAGYRWLALVLPVLALAATPALLNRAMAVALRIAGRPPMPAPLSAAGILRAGGWAVVSDTAPEQQTRPDEQTSTPRTPASATSSGPRRARSGAPRRRSPSPRCSSSGPPWRRTSPSSATLHSPPNSFPGASSNAPRRERRASGAARPTCRGARRERKAC